MKCNKLEDNYLNVNNFSTRKGFDDSIDNRLFITGFIENEKKLQRQNRTERNIYYYGMAAMAFCAGLGLYLMKETDYRETMPFVMSLAGTVGIGFSYLLADRKNEEIKMQNKRMEELENAIFGLLKN